jgi:5-methyltetrahydrofolate--homocysteine methyltransferase
LDDLFSKGDYFLPELIMGADAMKTALDIFELALVGELEREVAGTIVLDTVEGDQYEIGKNHGKKLLQMAMQET